MSTDNGRPGSGSLAGPERSGCARRTPACSGVWSRPRRSSRSKKSLRDPGDPPEPARQRRRRMRAAVEQLAPRPGWRRGAEALGVARASVYRHRQAPGRPGTRRRLPSPRALAPAERAQVSGDPARRPVRRPSPGRRLRHPAGGRPLPVLGAHHVPSAAGRWRGTGTAPA